MACMNCINCGAAIFNGNAQCTYCRTNLPHYVKRFVSAQAVLPTPNGLDGSDGRDGVDGIEFAKFDDLVEVTCLQDSDPRYILRTGETLTAEQVETLRRNWIDRCSK